MFCSWAIMWNRVIILYRSFFLETQTNICSRNELGLYYCIFYKSKTNKIVAHVHAISLSTNTYLLSTICRFSVHLSVQYVLSRSLLNAVIWWLVF